MPTYDYKCNACGIVWEEFKSISKRKEPESNPCLSCFVSGKIEQTIVFTNIPIGDPVRLGHVKPPIQFKERLQQIHENVPGSRLDKVSTIVKI